MNNILNSNGLNSNGIDYGIDYRSIGDIAVEVLKDHFITYNNSDELYKEITTCDFAKLITMKCDRFSNHKSICSYLSFVAKSGKYNRFMTHSGRSKWRISEWFVQKLSENL